MTKRFTRGFTLIELLVVIAIIGILSAVVLASLNTARAKGADANIKSNLTNIRAQAELLYDTAGGTYVNICADTAFIQRALTAAKTTSGATNANNYTVSVAGSAGTVTCHSTAAGWAAEAPLKSDPTQFWCVDSIGTSSGQAGGSTLIANDVTCG